MGDQQAVTADDLRALLDSLAGNAYMLLAGARADGPGEGRLRLVIETVHDTLDHLRSCAGERGRARTGGGPGSWSVEDRERWITLANCLGERIGALAEDEELGAEAETIDGMREAATRARAAVESVSPADIVATGEAALVEARRVAPATVLVVDDDISVRDIVSHCLKREGHRVVTATGGREALGALHALGFDAVLLDVVMPEMDGYETLSAIKSNPEFGLVPVLMLSGTDAREGLVRCLALGADDYLSKPLDPIFLIARLSSALEKKRLRDLERQNHEQLLEEQQRSRDLLLNVLPEKAARQLEYGQKMIANHYEMTTVLFADLVDFTEFASALGATDLVRRLNRLFQAFDDLVVEHGVEKIKTIGDAYLAVAGLPVSCDDHAERAARLALSMLEVARELRDSGELPLHARIGMHSGPVTAGVIGKLKFAYDIWGDTVNVASRMEESGLPDAIHVTEITHELLSDRFALEPRAPVAIKGKGVMRTWLLRGELEKVVSLEQSRRGREPS